MRRPCSDCRDSSVYVNDESGSVSDEIFLCFRRMYIYGNPFPPGKNNHLFFPSNHDFHFHLAIMLQRAVFFYVLINNCINVELCFLIPLHIYVFLMKKVKKLNKNGKYVEFRSCVCWIYTNIINLNLLDGIT